MDYDTSSLLLNEVEKVLAEAEKKQIDKIMYSLLYKRLNIKYILKELKSELSVDSFIF